VKDQQQKPSRNINGRLSRPFAVVPRLRHYALFFLHSEGWASGIRIAQLMRKWRICHADEDLLRNGRRPFS
jgi:hypothetical protein